MNKDQRNKLIDGLYKIKAWAEVAGDVDFWETANTAIRLLEQTEWISVKDKLPERDVDVLTYHRTESFDYQYVSWIDDYSGKWCGFCGNLSDEVLAWRPLPDVPIIKGR